MQNLKSKNYYGELLSGESVNRENQKPIHLFTYSPFTLTLNLNTGV